MPLVGRHLNEVKPAGRPFSVLTREQGPIGHREELPDIFVDDAVPADLPKGTEIPAGEVDRFIAFSSGMLDVPLGLVTTQQVEGNIAHVTFEATASLAEHPDQIGALLTRSMPRRLGVEHIVLSPEKDTTLSPEVLERAGAVAMSGNPQMVEFTAAA